MIEDMPSSQTTKPAVVFKPHAKKRPLVPYNAEKALELLMRRDPLPPVFASPADVKDLIKKMVGRNRFVIKQKSSADLMRYTMSDEG